MKFLIFLILFFSFSFAQDDLNALAPFSDTVCSGDVLSDLNVSIDGIGVSFSDLIFLSSTITLTLISLAYMLTKFLPGQYPNLNIWINENINHLFFSMILITMLSVSLKASCDISQALISSRAEEVGAQLTSNYYDYAQSYLNGLVPQISKTTSKLIEGSLTEHLRSTRYFYFGLPFISGGGVPFSANRKATAMRLEVYYPLMVPVMASIRFQALSFEILNLFKTYLFLIAVFLRFNPFTRDAGNIFIALFFSLYIVYPITVTFMALSFNNISICRTMHESAIQGDPYFSCNYLKFASTSGSNEPVGSLAALASFFPQAIFLPNLSILITATSASAIFKALKFTQNRFG